jgi:predicted phosphodiesterase
MKNTFRVAIVSDIHANALALDAVVKDVSAHAVDRVVMLGDLLTYGAEPKRTIDIICELAEIIPTQFVMGNHDILYFPFEGADSYFGKMPDWIKSSVNLTRAILARSSLDAIFAKLPWQTDIAIGGAFFAHANPFPFPDWRYLTTPELMQSASGQLSLHGYTQGFFGHSHRVAHYADAVGAPEIFTVRSVGQPRDASPRSGWSLLTLDDARFVVEDKTVSYDVALMLEGIDALKLPDSAKLQLKKFFI